MTIKSEGYKSEDYKSDLLYNKSEKYVKGESYKQEPYKTEASSNNGSNLTLTSPSSSRPLTHAQNVEGQGSRSSGEATQGQKRRWSAPESDNEKDDEKDEEEEEDGEENKKSDSKIKD